MRVRGRQKPDDRTSNRIVGDANGRIARDLTSTLDRHPRLRTGYRQASNEQQVGSVPLGSPLSGPDLTPSGRAEPNWVAIPEETKLEGETNAESRPERALTTTPSAELVE